MRGTKPRTGAGERVCGSALHDTAGRELVSAALIVDATMKAWAAHVVANKVPDALEAAAKRAYQEYQAAVQTAQEAYNGITGATGEAEWNEARAMLVAQSTALIDLITQSTAKAGLKNLLFHFAIPKLSALAPYFSIRAIRAELEAARRLPKPATLNRYLHELTEAHLIYDAGRGWYSNLSMPFTLNRKAVSTLVENLNKTFPLLDFSVWSTEQIASYGHLLLTKFLSFVHTESDAMQSVAESLRETGWAVYLNPTQQEAAKGFHLSGRTVVVRPAVSRAPVEEHCATIEKILVDLHREAVSLKLLDLGEFHRLVNNLAGQYRISIGTLAQYAERRGTKLEAIIAGESVKGKFYNKSLFVDSQERHG